MTDVKTVIPIRMELPESAYPPAVPHEVLSSRINLSVVSSVFGLLRLLKSMLDKCSLSSNSPSVSPFFPCPGFALC